MDQDALFYFMISQENNGSERRATPTGTVGQVKSIDAMHPSQFTARPVCSENQHQCLTACIVHL